MLLVATLGAFAGYVLLLPVVPLWAVHAGADETGAGLTNGVFMLVTVLTQLVMPWLLRRFDHRVLLASGIALLGAGAPLFAPLSNLGALLAVSGLRGVGFGLLTVTGSALVAELVAPPRRGRAAGLYGLAVGLPHALLLPVGVWLAEHLGFGTVFWLAALLPLTAALASFGIARVAGAPEVDRGRVALPTSLVSPWLAMTSVSIAAGGLVAFLPLAVGSDIGSIGLLAFGMATVGFRWVAGQIGDRFGSGRVVVPAMILGALGLGTLVLGSASASTSAASTSAAWTSVAAAGALGLGAGFGALQNAALVLMFERARPSEASTAWNIAYDAGNGLGSVGFGAVVTATDYPTSFAMAAALVVCGLPAGWLAGRRAGTPAGSSA